MTTLSIFVSEFVLFVTMTLAKLGMTVSRVVNEILTQPLLQTYLTDRFNPALKVETTKKQMVILVHITKKKQSHKNSYVSVHQHDDCDW